MDGFAIFHQIVTTQEAVVPMETRNASSYLLAFDNTNNLVLGVAVENVSASNAVIPVIIRDDTGAVVSSPGTRFRWEAAAIQRLFCPIRHWDSLLRRTSAALSSSIPRQAGRSASWVCASRLLIMR